MSEQNDQTDSLNISYSNDLMITEDLYLPNSNDSKSFNNTLPFPFSLNNSMFGPCLLNDLLSNDNIIEFSSNLSLNQTSDRTREIFIKKKKKYPRRFDIDNIIRKIKVHYTNKFLIKFINSIIKVKFWPKHKYCELKFYPLIYNKLKKTTKDCINDIKYRTIKDVIKNDISRRYKKCASNSNLKLCQKIEEEEELKDINDILELEFLYFFEKIYMQKKKKINLKEYGLFDLEIDLSTIELFEDLKLKNKNKEFYDIYEMRMEKYKNIFLNPTLKVNIFKTRKRGNKKIKK